MPEFFSLHGYRGTAALLLACASLSGCMLNPFGRGGDAEDETALEEDVDAPAPQAERNASTEDALDERISVLALDEELSQADRFRNVDLKTPPPYVNLAWPQAGGRADHTLHHLEARFDIKRDWKTNLRAKSSVLAPITSPPVIAEKRAYVVDPLARVHAVDVETGKTAWRAVLTPETPKSPFWKFWARPHPEQVGFGGGAAFDQGRLFVTSGFGFLAALDAETGEEIWRRELNAPARTPPTAYQGIVFAITVNNELVAHDQATGRELWTFQSFEESARVLASASPAAQGDLVIAPFSSGEIIAFRAQNGRGVWDDTLSRSTAFTSLSSLNDIAGAPVVDRGIVFAIGHGGRIAAVDLRSGRRVWEQNIAGVQMPWVAGRFVYVMSVDGELVCLSREDGAVAWVSEELPRFKNVKKRSGRIAWAGPVLAGDALILASSDGRLAQVAPEDGRLLRLTTVGEPVYLSPVVAGESVYVLTESGRLIAYR